MLTYAQDREDTLGARLHICSVEWRLDFCRALLCSIQPIQLYILALGSSEYQHGDLSQTGSPSLSDHSAQV